MKKNINIAFIQARIEADPFDDSIVEDNFERVYEMIDKACVKKRDLLILPDEIVGGYAYGPMNIPLEFENEYFEKLKEKAKRYSVYIAGAMLARQDYITSYSKGFLIDRSGNIVLEQNRRNVLEEEEKFVIKNQDKLKVVETDFGKVAFCIGIDILFPETLYELEDKNADIIISPNMFYGKDDNENIKFPASFFITAAQARAMEWKKYIMLSNSVGNEYHSEEALVGNSMIIYPDGNYYSANSDECIFEHSLNSSERVSDYINTYDLNKLRSIE